MQTEIEVVLQQSMDGEIAWVGFIEEITHILEKGRIMAKKNWEE